VRSSPLPAEGGLAARCTRAADREGLGSAKARFCMFVSATLLISSGLVINVADTVPRYDVKPTCQAAINLSAGTQGRTVESCVVGEERARKELEKDWSKIPIAERNQCIATMAKGGFPSYVELVICLEMTKDSRVHQEEERAKNVKSKTKKP
jgi:hypothetical protein